MTATVLAGIGAVTGYGWGVDAVERGLAANRSAAALVPVDSLEAIVARLPEPEGEPPAGCTSRFEQAALDAVDEALADARTRGRAPTARTAVVVCTGIGDIGRIRDDQFRDRRPRPSDFPHLLHTAVGSLVAQRHGFIGPNTVVNAACASGNVALLLAASWLEAGLADDVVVIAVELCVIEQIVTGFQRMRVHLRSDQPLTDCRPFQEGSRGFFLGEGAVAVVVSPDAVAPRARLLGGATNHDAHHLVAMRDDGVPLAACLRAALDDAGVDPDAVTVVKAHGSGTRLSDDVESGVVDVLFPRTTRLCTYKPTLGHCMAAAALVEMVGLIASHRNGRYPSRVSDHPAHPRLVDGEAPTEGLAMCCSVGLGGSNAAIVLDIATDPGA